MKILVVGGGIGGLTVSAFLERKGFSVTLIERSKEFKHVGLGMSIFGNGRNILKKLDIDEEINRTGYKLPWLKIVKPNGDIVGAPIDFTAFAHFGEPTITIERGVLHNALTKCLKKTHIQFEKTIKEVKNRNTGVSVIFSDGGKGDFDLMVAADGISSGIRDEFFGTKKLKFYGWSVRAFWIPENIPIPEGAICISEEKTTLAIYPLLEKNLAVIYEHNPAHSEKAIFDLKKFLPYLSTQGWTQDDINEIEKEGFDGKHLYDHLRYVKLGPWYNKRIALLGDAHHAFSPLIGMGGSMALEDAFVLADELGNMEEIGIEKALKNYENRRNTRIKEVRSFAKLVESFYFITSRF